MDSNQKLELDSIQNANELNFSNQGPQSGYDHDIVKCYLTSLTLGPQGYQFVYIHKFTILKEPAHTENYL